MGSKYDDDISNGESNRGNDTSLIVNVNDTQSDIDESNYSESEIKESSSSNKKESSSKKASRNGDSSKKSVPHKDKTSKSRSKVETSKTRYLWVSGIPDGTKTGQLEELFLQHGKVLAIKIIRGGSDSTLLGFVKLETVEQAQKCMEKLHRTEFRGNKIELLKERPVDKDGKKPEKIGFRDARKPFIPRSAAARPHFRPPHAPPRGPFRLPMKPSLHAPHRDHSRIATDFRRHEREEFLKLERERERVKLERMKLERDKAELLKIERESRVFERERFHDDKRVRSLPSVKSRAPIEEPYLEEKRYDDYSRRDEFGGSGGGSRRFESRSSPPDRKVASSRSFSSRRYEDNSRQGERYSDKYDSGSKWTSLSDSSWVGGGAAGGGSDNHRWPSSSGNFDSSSRILSSSIGSSSLSRLHAGSEISQGISSRSYFSSRRY